MGGRMQRAILALICVGMTACTARADAPAAPATHSAQRAEGTPMNDTTKNKPDKAELQQRLTPEQYHVTQECGTEPPFQNAYWNNHAPGIYVDIVSGEPLFSSTDKFES